MKTIDRDLLIRKYIDTDIAKFNNSDVKIVLENLKQNILKMPTTDRPQGEWIGGDVPTRCSICGHDWDEYVEGQEIWYEGSVPNFCPHCGVPMKGINDDI